MNAASILAPLRWGLDFIFPRQCHLCGGKLTDSDAGICFGCLSQLPRTGYHRIHDNTMEQRFAGLVAFERAAGHFFYSQSSPLAELMHDLKYRQFRGLARTLGSITGAELAAGGWHEGFDLVTCVPMRPWKQAMRGYNPSAEMAREVARAFGLQFADTLRMVRNRRTQTALDLDTRLLNAEGIFRARSDTPLDGHHVVIVDDVCTTGATLLAAATALRRQWPGVRISLLTIGVTF